MLVPVNSKAATLRRYRWPLAIVALAPALPPEETRR